MSRALYTDLEKCLKDVRKKASYWENVTLFALTYVYTYTKQNQMYFYMHMYTNKCKWIEKKGRKGLIHWREWYIWQEDFDFPVLFDYFT